MLRLVLEMINGIVLLLSPIFNLLQNLVGQLLLLLLVGVSCALDEEQAVLAGCRHVCVDVAQEADGSPSVKLS